MFLFNLKNVSLDIQRSELLLYRIFICMEYLKLKLLDKSQSESFVFIGIKQEFIIDNLNSFFATHFLSISNLVKSMS